MALSPKDRLIIALDVNSLERANEIIQETRDFCGTYKVGLELFSACGPEALNLVKKAGAQIFLDLKLHDIPSTVAAAINAAIEHKVRFLTIHSLGGPAVLKAAANMLTSHTSTLQLLAVSVLTHHDDAELKTIGFHHTSTKLALSLLENAYLAGIRGCICSALEASAVRSTLGAEMTIVCPGIRPHGSSINDQTRIATPALAMQNGADYIVVGRPITQAPHMKQAATLVLREIEEGLHAKTSH